jgi:hypothetical protein
MALANDVLIPVSVNEDKNEDADCIASKIATVLIDAFKVREGREPNNEEMEDLLQKREFRIFLMALIVMLSMTPMETVRLMKRGTQFLTKKSLVF